MTELILTVSLPNYNHGHYLRERIPSLLAAMPTNAELLIVDDGSSDDSVELIEKFASDDPRIVLIKNERNMGVNYSLNRILENAKGKYLAFQSADDLIYPDFFRKILNLASRYPEAGICCSDCGISYPDTPETIHTSRLLEGKTEPCVFSAPQALDLFRSTCFWIRGHTAIIKKDSVLKLGGFDSRLQPHDDWFLLHAVALQEGLAYLPETLAIWRQATDSYCNTILKNKKKKKNAHKQLLQVLSTEKYQNLRPLFKKSTLLANSIKLLFSEILFQPKYWDILGVLALKSITKKTKTSVIKLRKFNQHLTIFFSYLFFPFSLLLRLLKFRVLVHGPVIGNLCTQVDAYAKEKMLKKIPDYKLILYPFFASIFSSRPFRLSSTNNYLCHLWKQHFLVVTNPVLGFLLRPIFSAPWLQYERPYLSDRPNQCFYFVNQEYQNKHPPFPDNAILKIPEKDKEKGWHLLKKMGLKQNDWFVCFYAREPGYYDEPDLQFQGKIRNVKVETYCKALQEITSKGGWCIRVGSSKMLPLPHHLANLERVIDYPKSPFVSDFMDVFLAATCKFMLTCSSGISALPGLFGVPIAMTNTLPLHIAKPAYPKDLSILKLYYSKRQKRLLSFQEMLSSYITDQPNAYYYDSLDLQVIDNTEEEILELTREMFERLEGIYKENGNQSLQKKFSELIPQYLFCKYGTGNLGHHFLKTHAHLC